MDMDDETFHVFGIRPYPRDLPPARRDQRDAAAAQVAGWRDAMLVSGLLLEGKARPGKTRSRDSWMSTRIIQL